ncbi:MAG: hypothetical protein FWD58_02855 [Firmicutes bacterium]|nr:hypothetical protein [Bacillota bacterium]
MDKSSTFQRRFRQRAARNRFTINNPFITEDTKILDPDSLTDEQASLLGKISHDYAYLKQPQYEGLFVFALVEYDLKDNNQITGKAVAERAFFKDYESACAYFKTIGFIDYVCFQYEMGASGNRHLQGFMHYNRQIDFSMVRLIFPTIHLDPCTESNYYYRAYCCKQDTKIEGFEFFEHGVLVEARERTDIQAFQARVSEGASITELFEEFPHLTTTRLSSITVIQQAYKKKEFGGKARDLHITYIYGEPDAGKTTFLRRVLGYTPLQYGKITDYKSGNFDEYNGQDIIVFDEYHGQYPLTMFNDILDGEPRELPARYANRIACYTKVFIISNYAPDELYRKERADGKERSFIGFMRRITEIIYMPDRNIYIWQKGAPSEEVKATLDKQGAKFEI